MCVGGGGGGGGYRWEINGTANDVTFRLEVDETANDVTCHDVTSGHSNGGTHELPVL